MDEYGLTFQLDDNHLVAAHQRQPNSWTAQLVFLDNSRQPLDLGSYLDEAHILAGAHRALAGVTHSSLPRPKQERQSEVPTTHREKGRKPISVQRAESRLALEQDVFLKPRPYAPTRRRPG